MFSIFGIYYNTFLASPFARKTEHILFLSYRVSFLAIYFLFLHFFENFLLYIFFLLIWFIILIYRLQTAIFSLSPHSSHFYTRDTNLSGLYFSQIATMCFRGFIFTGVCSVKIRQPALYLRLIFVFLFVLVL